jgi:hypothetical protein
MSRPQKPKLRTCNPWSVLDRKRASQTILDCASVLHGLDHLSAAWDASEDDALPLVAHRIPAIEDRCLTLIERALSDIERAEVEPS